MIQTRRTADYQLIATAVNKQRPIKKEPLRPIGKLQVRNFLKKKLIHKQQSQITVDTISKAVLDPPPSPRLQRSRLFGLLDQTKVTCPVCLQILVRPLLLECGHTICLQCFEEYSNFALRCTTCRAQMSSPIQIEYKALDEWIKNKMEPLSEDGAEYWCRQGEFQEWQSKRRVNPWLLIPGDRLDFCTIRGWHPATFQELFTNQDNQLMARVSLKIQGQVIVEIELLACSRKLAPQGFFTRGLFAQARTSNRTQKFLNETRMQQISVESPLLAEEDARASEGMDFLWQGQIRQVELLQNDSNSVSEQKNFELELFEYEMNNGELDL